MIQKQQVPTWAYRPASGGGVEARLFSDATDIPGGEGWSDTPADLKPPPSKRIKGAT